MMRAFIVIVIGVILNGLMGCEKYIDFEEEVKEPKLVVNGLINPDSTLVVHISKSLSVIDNAQLSGVEDATVTILDENGSVYETLQHNVNGFYEGALKPVLGQDYSIEVKAPNYTNVTGATGIPDLVAVQNVDTVGFDDIDGLKMLEITFNFQDIPNEKNYYQLEVYGVDLVSGTTYTNPLAINSNDVSLGIGEDEFTTTVHFTDDLFEGQDKTFVIFVEDTRDYDDYLELRLSAVTEELHLYEETYYAYVGANGSPFAQPVQVYSNIEGGFGIFAGYQLSRRKINF